MDLTKKKIIVTGGAGFLGSFVVARLKEQGCNNVFVPRSKEYDLRDRAAIVRLLTQHKPEVIIHLAAVVGGIGANAKNPGSFFYDNAIMGLQLMEYSRLFKVEKFVAIGTICAYPKFTPTPFKEADLWSGYPEETNAPYGIAKKMMLVQGQAYREQYGFNSVYLLPVNLYGPKDNFDPESSHVIPALVRKCLEAKESGTKEIVLWGDGSPTREFLYVEDAAEAIVMATQKYDGREPVNLGSGEELSIRELATIVAGHVGFTGAIHYDPSRPNGQPRRRLDVSRALAYFGFQAKTSLREGLARTIRWYMMNRSTPATADSQRRHG